jgi:hypothetical protein
VSIPNSDIFVYFPYIFKAKRRKDLPGFQDFVQKIIDMGLSDLIYKKETNYYLTKKTKPKEESSAEKKSINWWFLD